MKSTLRSLLSIGALALCVSLPLGHAQAQDTTVILIGDSTVRNGTKGQQGWGSSLGQFFDAAKVKVDNRARGGRSSRTYFSEGLWEEALKEVKKGDYVLMQFGHNDNGPIFGEKARASIKGTGEETEEGDNPNGTHEVVHSYGWYLRKYIQDTKERGATPIVISPIPRNRWEGDKVIRDTKGHSLWAKEIAEAEHVPFIDLNHLVSEKYDKLGAETVKTYFEGDWTHTNPTGAEFNAECVIEGISQLKDVPLKNAFSAQGREAAKPD